MRFILLKDVEVMGVVHKVGTRRTIDSTDKVHNGIIEWCYGHGQYCPLKINEDVKIIDTLDVVVDVLNWENIKGALTYFQKESGLLLDINKLNFSYTINGYLFTYDV
jgi:hypothetical protein